MALLINKEITAVIHQPYFFPWMGYFSKLVYADKFVVLDNVFFSKRKFIDRVQVINTQGEKKWIGLPIGEHFNEPCNRIMFSDKKAIEKIVNNLRSSYSKARHYQENISQIERILFGAIEKSDVLTEINVDIITELLYLLDLKIPEILYSSQITDIIDPNDRLIELCEITKSKNLIVGSVEGIEKHDLTKLKINGINVFLQDFYNTHPRYYQTRRTRLGFAKGLSIVDCIFNEGVEKTKELLCLEPIPYKLNSILVDT